MSVDDIGDAVFLKIRELKIKHGMDYKPNLIIYMTYGFYYKLMGEIRRESEGIIDSYQSRFFERDRIIMGHPVYLVEQHLSQPHKNYQIFKVD